MGLLFRGYLGYGYTSRAWAMLPYSFASAARQKVGSSARAAEDARRTKKQPAVVVVAVSIRRMLYDAIVSPPANTSKIARR